MKTWTVFIYLLQFSFLLLFWSKAGGAQGILLALTQELFLIVLGNHMAYPHRPHARQAHCSLYHLSSLITFSNFLIAFLSEAYNDFWAHSNISYRLDYWRIKKNLHSSLSILTRNSLIDKLLQETY